MQLARDIPKNNKQYIPGITSQRSIGKLYGRLCNTSQNYGRTRRKNNQIPEDSGET